MIQKRTDNAQVTCADWMAVLEKSKPSDFDGHTDFRKMTPSQRLDALASMACFVAEYKDRARETQVDGH